jgi:hypothetical protein
VVGDRIERGNQAEDDAATARGGRANAPICWRAPRRTGDPARASPNNKRGR